MSRVERWLDDLADTLDSVSRLVARGKETYDNDEAARLACEALFTRVGEISKRVIAADPSVSEDPIRSAAARHRDFVVHHYDRVNYGDSWLTVTEDSPRLAEAVARLRTDGESSP